MASQAPPKPTSTTATSTGASANAAYAIAVMISKKVIWTPSISRSINECDVRLDLTPHLVEALVADRLAVNRDPLRHTHHVRAGESAGAQTIGPQQRFDHRSGAALAVRPGQVDDGIHPLGVAQEFGQRPDPPQAGCDTMFRPATGERGDDFGMSLFGRHDAQSLGRRRRQRTASFVA